MTGRLEIGITERLSSQGELFIRKKLALMFNNSNNSKSRLSSLVKKQTFQRKNFLTLWANSIIMSQKVNPTDAVREKLGEHPQLTSKAKLSYCHNWADNWSLGSIVIQTLMEDSLRLSPCRYQIFAEYVNREVMCLTHVNCRRRYPSLGSYFF